METQLDPSRVLDPSRFEDYERAMPSPLLPHVAPLLRRPGMAVCDVGGATGRFLRDLAADVGHPIDATVLEVVPDYRSRLVSPAIRFVEASILDSDLPDASFDVVTARHVLHHLVADSVPRTRVLQRRGLSEMLRLVRPGGHLVIEEQVHHVALFSRIVHWLSYWASRLRIRVPFFEAGTVVVSFMTPREIDDALEALRPELSFEVVHAEHSRRRVQWRWRLTLLMANVGDVVRVIRRGEDEPATGAPGPAVPTR